MAGWLSTRLQGGKAEGTFIKLAALEVLEIAAAELDFAVVDLEHSQLSEADALRLVRHGSVLDFPTLVRLHELDRGLVNRLLEAGAAGIQLSSVRTAAEVQRLRDACFHAPRGTRSISLAHPLARFGATPLADYLASYPAPLIVAQIETSETEDPLAAIFAAGVDVAFVGVTDLAVDLGLDEGRVEARIAEIVAAADEADVAIGGFGSDPRWRYSIASSDIALLRQAYARG